MYDLVIIDTPPVLPVADALIMGRWADGAVMAARYDASRLPLVERANRQIIAAGIPVLGVVVNGVKGQDQAYGSYCVQLQLPRPPEPGAGRRRRVLNSGNLPIATIAARQRRALRCVDRRRATRRIASGHLWLTP